MPKDPNYRFSTTPLPTGDIRGPGMVHDPNFVNTIDKMHAVNQYPQVPLFGGPDPNGPHSHGIKPHPHRHEIARSLLRSVTPLQGQPQLDMTRPLIDIVNEASAKGHAGLSEIADQHGFREMLKKAHRFTLDANTSAMVADLSLAIASDLDGARHMALPPYQVTWIDFDNVARLKRMEERGLGLTPMAKGEVEGPPVDRCGWLLYPGAIEGGYWASYFTLTDEGPVMAPLAWFWAVNEAPDVPEIPPGKEDQVEAGDLLMERLAFGMQGVNVPPRYFATCYAPIHKRAQGYTYRRDDYDIMKELSGELRHIWGLLVALSAGHAGLTMSSRPRARPSGPDPKQPNGKPLFALEHHDLTLHLGKRRDIGRVIQQAITHHRKRWHEVRGHFRKLQSGRLTMVKPHARGDKALGEVTKNYKVEK